MTLKKKAFEDIVGKGEMLVASVFSFSHYVFYSSHYKLPFLSQIYFAVCNCFQFDVVKNFVVGKELADEKFSNTSKLRAFAEEQV